MKRDDDCIRSLLLEAEADPSPFLLIPMHMSSSAEDIKRRYHATLLVDAGFFAQPGDSTYRLTNQGHDFLAAIRDDNAWRKIKEVAQSVGGFTLNMLMQAGINLLMAEASRRLGFAL